MAQRNLKTVRDGAPARKPGVFAVVVTFRPSENLLTNVLLLLAQVAHVAIVDNTASQTLPEVLQKAASLPAVTLLVNPLNEGIARAFNQGLKAGMDLGYQWLITFDQDSTVTPGMVDCLLRCFEEAGPGAGAVAPGYLDRNLGSALGEDRTPAGEVRTVLSSGMLLSRDVLNRVGLMEECLFIDSVDHEFCRRVLAHGFRLLQTGDAHLLHTLGNITYLRLFGRRFQVTNHSAARWYYQVRNRLWMLGPLRANSSTWWGLARREAGSLGWNMAKMLLAEDDRWRKTRLVMLGAWHAVLGKMGKTIEP